MVFYQVTIAPSGCRRLSPPWIAISLDSHKFARLGAKKDPPRPARLTRPLSLIFPFWAPNPTPLLPITVAEIPLIGPFSPFQIHECDALAAKFS